MTENSSTDLHMERAANQETVTGEHEAFPRWNSLIRKEKERQRSRHAEEKPRKNKRGGDYS